MNEIAQEFSCSIHKVSYWMDKYGIKRRPISDAVYLRHNAGIDPYKIKGIESINDAILYGLGIGLYWGEGNKANKNSVRLGNSDPHLIVAFVRFLTEICGVDKARLRFSLQIFSDLDGDEILRQWAEILDVSSSQFYKITVTISGSVGTYRTKSKYGVLTVYFHNTKLRNELISRLPT